MKIIRVERLDRCPYFFDAGNHWVCRHPDNWCRPCEQHGGKCPLEEVEA
jgi:hypothetical protein